MNITGLQNYSREVGTMRSPSQNRDVSSRLIFTYPFGIDQSIVNLPFNTYVKGDNDTVGDALRSFFSISILKEIFTSNALNLVTLASTFERNKRVVDKSSALINTLLRGNNDNMYQYRSYPMYEPSDIDANELQTKINQKFDQIKQNLRTDPRLKKFLPFMQVITLQNFLDVPVITGTAQFQLDTTALFTLLATAISTRVKLDEWSGVRRLIGHLKSMSDLTVYQAINVLTNCQDKIDNPRVINNVNSLEGQLLSLQNELGQEDNPIKKSIIQTKINRIQDQYAQLTVSELKDTKLKELERNFMFMLDLDKLMIRNGISIGTSQASYAKKKISLQTDMLFSRTKQQFIDFLAGADPIFSSIYMLLSPIVTTDPAWGETYLTLKSKFIDYLLDNFDTFMNHLITEFDTLITKNIETSSQSISAIKKSCDTAKEDFVATLNMFNKQLSENQLYSSFSYSDVEKFSTALDKIVSNLTPIQKNVKQSIIEFLGGDTSSASRIFTALNSLLSNSLDIFFTKFNLTRDPSSQLQARIFSLDYDDTGEPDAVMRRRKDLHKSFFVAVAESTKVIAQTIFLMIFKLNLCDFVEIADVEFGLVKNDALDLPNYVLAIPLEVAQALFTLYTVRNWKLAVMKSGSEFNPLNQSYIKGVVKLLRKQLAIPNIFVFDKKKNEIYYSFQYMGIDVEKLKLQSLETFIKHYLQDKSTGVTQLYY